MTILSRLALACTVLLAGCRSPGPPVPQPQADPPVEVAPSAAVCPRPGGEFGADGCALVTGRVVRADGRPLSGAGLGGIIAAGEGCSACNNPGLRIDAEGRFSEVVHWFSTDPPDSALATVRVAAVGPGYPITGDRPAYSDSARVVLRFAPIGQPVRPSPPVVLRLPVP
jgi:hypothetical protein